MEAPASAEIQEEANALIVDVNSLSGNEIPNREVREANASIGNEHPDRVLGNRITQEIENWKPPISTGYCIYRVPDVIRNVDEDAYTPLVISIGPFHHGKERLKPMEKVKVYFLKILVKNSALNVENSLSTIRSKERSIRSCYGEPSKLESDDYAKMILMDASFIIVLFLTLKYNKWNSLASDLCLIASGQSVAFMYNDTMLLENQLPFSIIEKLYNFAFPSPSNYSYFTHDSFAELTFEVLAPFNSQEMPYNSNLIIAHILGLVRTIFLPTSIPERESSELSVELFYSVSQLHDAGVNFKSVPKESLFNLNFTDDGVLEIPCFSLSGDSVRLFRNLMALEQLCFMGEAYVTDYIRMLNLLIDTAKDVDLLVREKILLNRLSDSNVVATRVNNLGAKHGYDKMNSYHTNLCENLNKFYERRRHRWKAALISDYFSNPWRTTATIAAFILLVLTLIQSVCSIISVT